MPKLKSALANHQAHQARLNAQAKSSQVNHDKERSIKYGKSKKAKTKVGGGVGQKATTYGDTGQIGQMAGPSGSIHGINPTSLTKGKGKARAPTNPIDKDDTVLLLGEANFSFALSLVSSPHSHPPTLVCATSYDSEKTCYQKYPDAAGHVDKLRALGVNVGFDVDAGALEKSKSVVGKGRRWSRIIFNFPHVGAGITDQDRNILSNQHLLLRTFRSVAPFLSKGPSKFPLVNEQRMKKRKRTQAEDDVSDVEGTIEDVSENENENEDAHDDPSDGQEPSSLPRTTARTIPFTTPKKQGTILITVLNQPPYTLWNLSKLGTKPPPLCPGTTLPQPRYTLLRSFAFAPELWRGYEHRRTLGFKEGLSKRENMEIIGRKGEARTWEFALKADEGEEIN